MQVPSLKEPSLKEPSLSELGPKWSSLKKPSALEPGAVGLNIIEHPIIIELSADGPCIRDKNGDCR